MLAIGSGTYGGKPGKEMVAYLENLKSVTGRRAACFASCVADSTKSLAAMKEILTSNGYSIVDCFSCLGTFCWFN